jgi:hypothetical protein
MPSQDDLPPGESNVVKAFEILVSVLFLFLGSKETLV